MTRRTPPELDPIAAAYIAWCEQERVPDNTVRRRRSVLRAVGNPGTATRAEIEAWWVTRDHLDDGRPRADSSRANDLAVLRSFYKWCQVWEHRDDNPTVRLSPPRVPNSVPRPAARTQLDQILEHIKDRPDLRRAVFLGAYAGLRVSEAAALRWRDINTELRIITVLGKGRKRRLVTVSEAVLEQLLPDTGGNVVAGDPDDPDKRWTADALRRRVNRAIAAAGVDVTFHQLRHRFGTIAYQASNDLVAVRDLMGHASIATTSGYAAANATVAEQIAQAVAER